jgi:bifunctional N-acetylglucosamine-1-phosphate-uridyltransferase/glucosamine-1-phosphate-acetyltransferase GlmU-like protein
MIEEKKKKKKKKKISIRAISSSNPHQYGRINSRSAHYVSE